LHRKLRRRRSPWQNSLLPPPRNAVGRYGSTPERAMTRGIGRERDEVEGPKSQYPSALTTGRIAPR
ncbi:MAG: hypothetical protein MI756_00645, partial [Chromatiales bacterium]|nr:hypothetical protein [Chromatiales bacterium]